MEAVWYEQVSSHEQTLLAGDVGGTNTSLALVGRRGRDFRLLARFMFRSRELHAFSEALEQALAALAPAGGRLRPELCCISGAGPVTGRVCRPTNLAWQVDGAEVERLSGLPCVVINDFTAVSYGIPLLDTRDPEQILEIPHLDGAHPVPAGAVRAVVGAGTGLGVGFLIEDHGRFIACPSEGGHADFAGFDLESRAFGEYLGQRCHAAPGAELFVSGQGLEGIYGYFLAAGRLDSGEAGRRLAAAAPTGRPALIAELAESDPTCRDMLLLFVRMYGRFASNAALSFLPQRGLYLAGGIAAKNSAWFAGRPDFMRAFESNYRANMRELLKSIPVYIILDYSVSLYGAAHAAYSLL